MSTCFYCGKRDASEEFRHKVSLYKKRDSSIGIGVLGIKRTTKYYEKEIEIDRCGYCNFEHKKANRPALIWSLIILIISASIAYILALRVYIAVISGIAGALVTLVIYFSVFYRRHIKSLDIKDQYEVNEHPQVKEMKDNGWSLLKP